VKGSERRVEDALQEQEHISDAMRHDQKDRRTGEDESQDETKSGLAGESVGCFPVTLI